jgi:CHAT domain-containing protein/tetratricopeptide (TPR) repeat protein
MSLTFRASLYLLALGMIVISPSLAQSQSSSSDPNSSRSSAEPVLRAVVEKYFALYASKDLNGLMSLWSEKSPDYASFKQSLQEQFAAEDYSFSIPAISRLKVEGERASLRATVNLTAINSKGRQKREQQFARNFSFFREAETWKVWRSVPAENDLAEALAQVKTEAERARLLADEKELVTSELVRALVSHGGRLRSQLDYQQSLTIYRLAQSIAEQIGDQSGIATAWYSIGLVHHSQREYAQALERHQKSLALFEALGDQAGISKTLNGIGNVYLSQDSYAQALERYEKSLALSETLGDKAGIASTLGNIGLIHYLQGNYAQALEYNHKILVMFEALGDKRRMRAALNNLGAIYDSLGDYARALEYYQKSLPLQEAFGDKNGVAGVLNNIGTVYSFQGDYAQALRHYQQSLALREAIGDKSGIGDSLHDIGRVHRFQGDYAQAFRHYQQSLALRETIGDKSGIASTLNNIGLTYSLQGDYAKALEYHQQSLALREAIGDKAGIADALNNMGEAFEKQGRYPQALDTASRAAALAGQIGYSRALWKAHFTAGVAYRALNQPALARPAFEESITTIEALRANVAGGVGERQRFFESKVSPYHAMVDLLAHEGRPAEALIFAERAKSRALLDVLRTGRANVTKAMTGQEQEQERKLNGQLVALNTQISRESARPQPDQARLTELKAQLQKARLDFEAFQTNLYGAHPELRSKRGEAQPLRLEEAASLLPDAASALLEYIVTDDKTYLFAITKAAGKTETDIRVYTLPVKRDELTRQTESFRRQLAGRDLGFRDAAAKLYDLLLKPAQAQLRGKTSLIIVPDDKLWDLPYQALLAAPNRFMIENASIAYAPSLTVLREMMKRRRNQRGDSGSGTLLALGNPALGKETIERAALALRDEKLTPLPEAELEVKALSRLYGMSRSKVYIGAEASEDRLKVEAAQARVLHFATHGILNNASPIYSHLALAQGDKNEDGLLEAWELMRLDLKADLAVLSACETARGRFGAGEGVIGLSWALFVAGVPSTVVSQWKVESASTRDLMLSFHAQLKAPPSKAKRTKAEALRQAALKLMKNPETSHPFYWAGFVLVGDGQ